MELSSECTLDWVSNDPPLAPLLTRSRSSRIPGTNDNNWQLALNATRGWRVHGYLFHPSPPAHLHCHPPDPRFPFTSSLFKCSLLFLPFLSAQLPTRHCLQEDALCPVSLTTTAVR